MISLAHKIYPNLKESSQKGEEMNEEYFKNPSESRIAEILQNSKRMAVIGLSPKAHRDSYKVAEFMQQKGYKIYPVNPAHAGKEILGEHVYASVEEIPERVDIIDVFRRSELLPEVAKAVKNIDFGFFWAQLGLSHPDVPKILGEKFKDRIIMDRCIKLDWDALL